MNYTVEYVELKDGKKPFEEFILGLPIHERVKVFETINYFVELKNNHLPIKENISKHLEDGIFEVRTTFSKRIARSIYFYQKGARVIITHGFIKKTNKTPRKEIERAKAIRSFYNKKEGNLL